MSDLYGGSALVFAVFCTYIMGRDLKRMLRIPNKAERHKPAQEILACGAFAFIGLGLSAHFICVPRAVVPGLILEWLCYALVLMVLLTKRWLQNRLADAGLPTSGS